MQRAALRLVERPSFYEREGEFWSEAGEDSSHSLHSLFSFSDSFSTELASYFIRKFSEKGQTIFDPFSGAGVVPLEATLLGRVAFATDRSPLSTMVTAAKLSGVDLPEATILLQTLLLQRPIDTKVFRDQFYHFFEIQTYRELSNIRLRLLESSSKTAMFLLSVGASILHGHTSGHCSVHTFPQMSVEPHEQALLNERRNQSPAYRAVIPRMLRKVAMTARDGIPSQVTQGSKDRLILTRDSRSLDGVPNSSVDLVITAPPLPNSKLHKKDQWLRAWFLGVDEDLNRIEQPVPNTLDSWLEFMNESLLELARVTRRDGKAIFIISHEMHGKTIAEAFQNMIQESLSRYWEPECLLIQAEAKKIVVGRNPINKPAQRALVLRRL